IGSHWNNLTTFQFRYEHVLYKKNFLAGGVSLSHISNGAFKAPNLGLNYISAILGYSFHFKPYVFSTSSTTLSAISSVSSMISASVEYGITLKEGQIPGGPKFLIQWC